MNLERIIFGLGVLIGLTLLKQTKPFFLKVTLLGVAACAASSFFDEYVDINIPFFSFGFLSFVFTVWCGMQSKWTSMVIGLFAFSSFVWSFLNYPYWGVLQFLMIIPLGIYIWMLSKKEVFKKEFGVLTGFIGFELSEFVLF